MRNTNFASEHQELLWKAFKGECGSEFAGHPVIMQNIMDLERFKGVNFEERER